MCCGASRFLLYDGTGHVAESPAYDVPVAEGRSASPPRREIGESLQVNDGACQELWTAMSPWVMPVAAGQGKLDHARLWTQPIVGALMGPCGCDLPGLTRSAAVLPRHWLRHSAPYTAVCGKAAGAWVRTMGASALAQQCRRLSTHGRIAHPGWRDGAGPYTCGTERGPPHRNQRHTPGAGWPAYHRHGN